MQNFPFLLYSFFINFSYKVIEKKEEEDPLMWLFGVFHSAAVVEIYTFVFRKRSKNYFFNVRRAKIYLGNIKQF